MAWGDPLEVTPNNHDLFALFLAVLSAGVAWGIYKTKVQALDAHIVELKDELKRLRSSIEALGKTIAYMQGRSGRPVAEPGPPPESGSGLDWPPKRR